MKFFQVASLSDCHEIVQKRLPQDALAPEVLSCVDAVGLALAGDVHAQDVFPPYTRSTVDGYAVVAQDVYCCSASLPAFLKVVGKVAMGEMPSVVCHKGEAVQIATGGVLPEGANAVVMVEHIQTLGEQIAVYSPVKQGENLVKRGEELEAGDLIARRGDLVTPLLVGVLASVGIDHAAVYRPIRIAVISTGDELVGVDEEVTPGKIRDVNTSLLTAVAKASGYQVVSTARIPDDEALFLSILQEALDQADWVFVSGGSSIGAKDLTEKVLSRGEILLHGLALKPGKPTIIAAFGDKTVYGLPGNPFAALCVFRVMIDEVVKSARGQAVPTLRAYAKTNFPSTPGRATIVPVSVEWAGDRYLATPLFLKSAHLYTAMRANGYVLLPEQAEGVYQGELLTVYPLEGGFV